MREMEVQKVTLHIDPTKEQAVTQLVLSGQLGDYLSNLINVADMDERVNGKLTTLEEQMGKMLNMLEMIQTNKISLNDLSNIVPSRSMDESSVDCSTPHLHDISTETHIKSSGDEPINTKEIITNERNVTPKDSVSKPSSTKSKKKKGLGTLGKISGKMAELERGKQ